MQQIAINWHIYILTKSPVALGLVGLMRVVPIIVRPCMWQSEPALVHLNALPKDGKAVVTYPTDNGQRDQVWADIASVLEKRARK